MKALQRSCALLCLVVGTGCGFPAQLATPLDASGHPSTNMATDAGLVIHGYEVTDLASESFGVIVVSFENTRRDWIRIRRVSLGFGSAANDRSVFVPWGTDLEGWAEAAEARNAQRLASRRAMMYLFSSTGSLARGVGAARGNRSLFAAGEALGAAGGIAAVASLEKQMGTLPLPSGHLLAEPFSVPPEMTIRKWIVLNTPRHAGAPCIPSAVLEYELEDARTERVSMPILDAASEWQREACPRRSSDDMRNP